MMQFNFAYFKKPSNFAFPYGAMAEWLGTGLQNLLQRFDSASHLQKEPPGYWRALFVFIRLVKTNSSVQAPGSRTVDGCTRGIHPGPPFQQRCGRSWRTARLRLRPLRTPSYHLRSQGA